MSRGHRRQHGTYALKHVESIIGSKTWYLQFAYLSGLGHSEFSVSRILAWVPFSAVGPLGPLYNKYTVHPRVDVASSHHLGKQTYTSVI